jgi:superfamily II DNA or RNA helicase
MEYGNRLLEIIHRYTHLYRTYYADDERSHLLEFSKGAIDCLVTCHKISQGIDIRLLRTVILFSAARSKLETIQRIGRCLRVDPANPDKRARVVDFVRPDDEDDEFLNADQERRDWLHELSLCRREVADGA